MSGGDRGGDERFAEADFVGEESAAKSIEQRFDPIHRLDLMRRELNHRNSERNEESTEAPRFCSSLRLG